jgi:hypothetical protein
MAEEVELGSGGCRAHMGERAVAPFAKGAAVADCGR